MSPRSEIRVGALKGERAAQEAPEKFTHRGRRPLPAFAKSEEERTIKLERARIFPGIAKGAADRSGGNVNGLPSFLLDGARKIERGEEKKAAEIEEKSSGEPGRLEWSTHVVQSDFSGSGTCGDR